jgi:succinate dehydrogenase / fumarate reductase cytochrome b subunit
VPLGAFLILHLSINLRALEGDVAFAHVVDALDRAPGLPLLEDIFVFGPLLLHGLVGLWLVTTRTPLRSASPYPPAVRIAMRVTGVFLAAFLAMHLSEFRFRMPGTRLDGTQLGTSLAADLSATWLGVPWRGAAYLVGTGCVTFHFAAGLWGVFLAESRGSEGAHRRKWAVWVAAAVGSAVWIAFASIVVFHATGARLFGEPAVENGNPNDPCPKH